jgi:hypothetical protein
MDCALACLPLRPIIESRRTLCGVPLDKRATSWMNMGRRRAVAHSSAVTPQNNAIVRPSRRSPVTEKRFSNSGFRDVALLRYQSRKYHFQTILNEERRRRSYYEAATASCHGVEIRTNGGPNFNVCCMVAGLISSRLRFLAPSGSWLGF